MLGAEGRYFGSWMVFTWRVIWARTQRLKAVWLCDLNVRPRGAMFNRGNPKG